MYKLDLNCEWLLRCEGLEVGPDKLPAVLDREGGWMTADLPCDVHMPLLDSGQIEEPLEADNFYRCEWIEKKSWWFKKTFNADDRLLTADVAELTLEALDAEADIFLNGIYLGHQRSTFYPFSLNVREFLARGKNTLSVRVTSGLEHISELDLAQVNWRVSTESTNGIPDRGDKRRAFVRKPQYVYGWDWSPRVATCGIVNNVYIKAYRSLAVRSVHAVTKSVGEAALLDFEIEVENLHPYSSRDAELSLEISLGGMCVFQSKQSVFLRSGLNFFRMGAEIMDAQLWWPNGMGAQPLYDIRVSAASGQERDEYPVFRYGIRTLRLNLESLSREERLFAFELNGVKVFCKGGNWIPADAIYARVSDEKYDALLREAREANFTMLRVWGGGLYERDIFYEKCDEYGILLWQDMMFACAIYPDQLPWFRTEFEKELDYQTLRLRNHASLALWSGNNENTWAFDEWWKDSEEAPIYGGAICYNVIAPRIVRSNCPEIPYWNGSPYGGVHPNGNEVGDRHHWFDCTMNPDMEKRITPEEYDKVSSKFVSEYGYIGPCCKSSILRYHGGAPLDRGGPIWQHHNNTFEKKTVAAGIAKHYVDPDGLDIDQYLLYAGLCQGLMYGYSLESLRFKEYCWGGLFWMYDDCWGEVGWTIIDYYLKRKPSFYFVKRAFAPKSLILREEGGTVRVMGINETSEAVSFDAEYGYLSFDGRDKAAEKTTLRLEPHSRKQLLEFSRGDFDTVKGTVYMKPLTGNTGILPAVLRVCEFRKLRLPEAAVQVSDIRCDGKDMRFQVSCNTYAHAVHFGLDDDVRLSDEYFDLLPGESREVTVFDAAGRLSADNIRPITITSR